MILFPLFFTFSSVILTIHGFAVENDCQKKISIRASRTLSSVSPTEVVEAFKQYTWKRGGGLPVYVVRKNEKERILVPLMATERLSIEDQNEDSQSQLSLTYHLLELGPIWRSEIVNGSHIARVTFEKDNTFDTILTWNVEFTTKRNHQLWKFITQQMVDQACNNLQSYCAKPILFSHTVEICTEKNAAELIDQWIDFVWKNGGGLPLPIPPIALTSDFHTRMIAPPFMIEQLKSIETKPGECSQVVYTVKNPSILTYQVHSHIGRVYFKPIATNSCGIEMLWEVNIRPMYGWESLVKLFTSYIIMTLSNNFVTSIEQPDGPKAQTQVDRPLFTVFKYSWIGNLMDNFFSGNRSIRDVIPEWKIKDIKIE
jgi:hypothetical protein